MWSSAAVPASLLHDLHLNQANAAFLYLKQVIFAYRTAAHWILHLSLNHYP